MKTPRHSLFPDDGKVLKAILWITLFAFFVGLLTTWIGSRRANRVMLDLETGEPVKQKPPL